MGGPGRARWTERPGPSRASVAVACTALHASVVLALLALLAVTAAVDGHVRWPLPPWVARTLAPWGTVLLLGLAVLPVLGLAALVQVRELRRGVASSPALVVSWLPFVVSAGVLVVVNRGLGWAPAIWLAGEVTGMWLTAVPGDGGQEKRGAAIVASLSSRWSRSS